MYNQNQQQGFKPTGLINPDQYFRPGVPDYFDLQEVNKAIEMANSVGYDISIPVKRLEAQMQRKDYKNYRQAIGAFNQEYKNIQEFAKVRQQENAEAQKRATETSSNIASLVGKLYAIQSSGGMVPSELAGAIASISQDPSASLEDTKMLVSWMDSLPSVSESSRMQKEKIEAQKLQKEQAEATAGKQRLIKRIGKFVTEEGLPKESLISSTGFGEGFSSWMGKKTGGGVLFNEPKEIRSQQELAIVVEKDLLDATKYLKPVSNDEIKMLRENRPAITDPPEVWAGYLNEIRSVIENDEFITSETPATTQGQPSTQPAAQQQPQSPISRANARFQKFAVPAPNVGE